jgi:diaminohydroxyphosphoribosylaminopyrimidine deaminase / 5-amino-6-(5-phosphoribosylamino)uracil reductase
MQTADIKWMKRAILLARKGIGKTSPNPAVGCVIVKNGVKVGEGWHKKAGLPHAEINALAQAGEKARGADLYVTLEPCSHHGKTPPCAEALVEAGVRRVVIGMEDPYPLVSGRGIKGLKDAGIEVAVGCLEEQCRELNLGFIKSVSTGIPYLIYKSALTMDGNIATVTGHSQWVTCEESRKTVHKLRAKCDAVMVGVDTIIADNPQLTVRHAKGRNPLRIIVDTHMRTPESVNVLTDRNAKKTIIATTETNPKVHRRYTKQGATVVVCHQLDGRVDLHDMMTRLGSFGIQSILLEGGSRLAGDMLRQGLIDELVFFYAPKVIGSDGFAPFNIQGLSSMDDAVKFKITECSMSGDDLMVIARPEVKCSPV